MKFFELDEDRNVKLNKEWIGLIPEFAALLKRDKGSKGDYRGEKKMRATREFTYIFFMEDFSSPIRDYEPEEKKHEALRYADLEESAIDDLVEIALSEYSNIQIKSARSLRTLRAVWKGMEATDDYFENIDYLAKDKQGKLLNTAEAFIKNVATLNKLYDEIRKFEQRVEAELKDDKGGIRGPNSSLGDKEGKGIRQFDEGSIRTGSELEMAGAQTGGGGSFLNLLKMKQDLIKGVETDQQLPKPAPRNPNAVNLFADDEEQ